MVSIKRNQGANANIQKAYNNGIISNILKRLAPKYMFIPSVILGKPGSRYSVFNNRGTFVGFAAVRNYSRNVREIELIGTRKGYGDMLIKQIIKNAEINNKKYIELNAANMSPNGRLIQWYKNRGFSTGAGNSAHMRYIL